MKPSLGNNLITLNLSFQKFSRKPECLHPGTFTETMKDIDIGKEFIIPSPGYRNPQDRASTSGQHRDGEDSNYKRNLRVSISLSEGILLTSHTHLFVCVVSRFPQLMVLRIFSGLSAQGSPLMVLGGSYVMQRIELELATSRASALTLVLSVALGCMYIFLSFFINLKSFLNLWLL